MLRLIKLAVYGLIGYAIYEFYRGVTMTGGGQQGGGSMTGGGGQGGYSGQGMGGQGPSLGQNPQSMNTPLMGGSESPQGMLVPTQDADGGSVTHSVGRGVVHR
ncbi:MAG TPA: hypothetical protein VGN72_02485 [Tepidisphaeraceae bacterium]|jgi:hypothetical protein|nr:hypothetical protein [Tepidisphaeraceae bacterium]